MSIWSIYVTRGEIPEGQDSWIQNSKYPVGFKRNQTIQKKRILDIVYKCPIFNSVQTVLMCLVQRYNRSHERNST